MSQKLTISGVGDIIVTFKKDPAASKYTKYAHEPRREYDGLSLPVGDNDGLVEYSGSPGDFNITLSDSSLNHAKKIVNGNNVDSDLIEFYVFK